MSHHAHSFHEHGFSCNINKYNNLPNQALPLSRISFVFKSTPTHSCLMQLSQTGKQHWRGSTMEVVGLADECMGTICMQVGVAMALCQCGLGYAAFFINLLLNFWAICDDATCMCTLFQSHDHRKQKNFDPLGSKNTTGLTGSFMAVLCTVEPLRREYSLCKHWPSLFLVAASLGVATCDPTSCNTHWICMCGQNT